MYRLSVTMVIVCLAALAGSAQDPLKVVPQNYKLEFENEWVKVVRVHYGAKEKIPVHDHTEYGAAYVYLNDAGPVIFKHIGASYGAITRPEVKAGSFRLYKAVKEVHEVENPGDTPSDFLRIEFKTEPLDQNNFRGKYYRETFPEGQNWQKIQFENEQVRITRLACSPGNKVEMAASATDPALLVALSPAQFKTTGPKTKLVKLSLEPGRTEWLSPGEKKQFENTGGSPAELLRFDLKTKPVKRNPNEKEKPHSHSNN